MAPLTKTFVDDPIGTYIIKLSCIFSNFTFLMTVTDIGWGFKISWNFPKFLQQQQQLQDWEAALLPEWQRSLKIEVFRSKDFKVISCQSWRSQEKVSHLALALLEPVGQDSSCSGVKSFSKFEGRSFCSPLTYRPQIFSIDRSKPFWNYVYIPTG